MKRSFVPKIPMIEVILVRNQKDLDKYGKLGDYELAPIGGALAKAIHITHSTTKAEAIIVHYPTMLQDEPIQVTSTLVHEAVHCWDYMCNTYGYENDLELNAYSIENIFIGLYTIYAEMHAKQEKRNARRT